MEKAIKLKPIGIIKTPYKELTGIPIQGRFKKGIIGTIEIFPEYQQGLKEDEEYSIFAIRSPHRPNHSKRVTTPKRGMIQ